MQDRGGFAVDLVTCLQLLGVDGFGQQYWNFRAYYFLSSGLGGRQRRLLSGSIFVEAQRSCQQHACEDYSCPAGRARWDEGTSSAASPAPERGYLCVLVYYLRFHGDLLLVVGCGGD